MPAAATSPHHREDSPFSDRAAERRRKTEGGRQEVRQGRTALVVFRLPPSVFLMAPSRCRRSHRSDRRCLHAHPAVLRPRPDDGVQAAVPVSASRDGIRDVSVLGSLHGARPARHQRRALPALSPAVAADPPAAAGGRGIQHLDRAAGAARGARHVPVSPPPGAAAGRGARGHRVRGLAGPIVSSPNFPNMSWSICAVPFVFWALERLFEGADRPRRPSRCSQ